MHTLDHSTKTPLKSNIPTVLFVHSNNIKKSHYLNTYILGCRVFYPVGLDFEIVSRYIHQILFRFFGQSYTGQGLQVNCIISSSRGVK